MATGAVTPNMGASLPGSMVPGAMPPPPPMGGSYNNPTGTSGGSSTAMGAPVLPNIAPSTQATIPGAAPSSTSPVTTNGPGMVSSPIAGNTYGDLTDIYGAGIGGYLSELMGNGGMNMGLLNQVNASEMNAMSGPVNQGAANLNATLGAEGVSANSSTNVLANSQYQQGATANENSQIAQNYMDEYNQGQETERSILPGVMNNAGDQPNWMDYLGMGENFAQTGIMGAMMLGA